LETILSRFNAPAASPYQADYFGRFRGVVEMSGPTRQNASIDFKATDNEIDLQQIHGGQQMSFKVNLLASLNLVE
jgi:hypothetical protein